MARTIWTIFFGLLFFSCSSTPTPDPARVEADAADFREIRDSGIPPVQRLIARNKAAFDGGVSLTQLAFENGIALFRIVMETYVMPRVQALNPPATTRPTQE